MKKILYYLGKVPAMGSDIDGGSILSKQLIDTLKEVSKLDVIFRRTDEKEYIDDKINSIRYIKEECLGNNRFWQRVVQSNLNRTALSNYRDYDVVIVQHSSLLFGTSDFVGGFWDKVILFPMFLSQSYIKANEILPEEYIVEEKKIMDLVKTIITPSILEKEDILNFYKGEKKIFVLPRGITKFIKFEPKNTIGKRIRLINIGSIKKQKNQIDSLRVLKYLIDNGVDASLQLITTIQDKKYYEEIKDFILENNLERNVEIYCSLSQFELASKIKNIDFNISTSRWETFGRGIYEGVCGGKVSFVLKDLEEVKRFVGENKGVVFCENWLDMAKQIHYFIANYQEEIKLRLGDLKVLSDKVSYDRESQKLMQIILAQ